MKLIALDLETTGLNPQTDQIIEIGMVCFESDTGEILGDFTRMVAHPRYEGDAYALQMNAALLLRLATEATADNAVWCTDLMVTVRNALAKWGFDSKNKPIAVGWNVAPFDLAFLKAAGVDLFLHRAVEVGTLLMPSFEKAQPVGSTEFMEAYSGGKVAHTALADCYMAVNAYLFAMGRQ